MPSVVLVRVAAEELVLILATSMFAPLPTMSSKRQTRVHGVMSKRLANASLRAHVATTRGCSSSRFASFFVCLFHLSTWTFNQSNFLGPAPLAPWKRFHLPNFFRIFSNTYLAALTGPADTSPSAAWRALDRRTVALSSALVSSGTVA